MIQEMMDKVWTWCADFGGQAPADFIQRRNVADRAFEDGAPYFACIRPEEASAGAYHDLSFVVFPDDKDGPWLVSLCVGTLGFNHDYDLAALPGLRRRFLRLISDNGYVKTDFTDINTSIDKAFLEGVPNLRKSMDNYKRFLPACEIVRDPLSQAGQSKIKAFLALYAQLREWPSNNSHRAAVAQAIAAGTERAVTLAEEDEAEQLLLTRRFLVLQGAPGTGKTRLAKRLAERLSAKVFFTQFHAETSYADFVWGIRPRLEGGSLGYEAVNGPLLDAIEYARSQPKEKVLLVVDEINRANLSNVLGPVFYLFEYQMQQSAAAIRLSDSLTLSALPDNLYVVATMNTADRSLAVVDFALRRRFAWYTLRPRVITADPGLRFFKADFDAMAAIFDMHASDEELNLMPGQGYFIADSEEHMLARLRYELMPLIKEYLTEGLLSTGRDAFVNYSHQRLKEAMFR